MEARAFLAMLQRDLLIERRDLLSNLVQWLMLPALFLFILGNVLPRTGVAQAGYGALLLPGIVAMTLLSAALLSVTAPLVMDIGNEREIEDRLLAPLPVAWVALEKVLFSALTSLGLAFGTAVKPEQIGVLNAVILTPIMFTGCAFLSLGIRGFIEER